MSRSRLRDVAILAAAVVGSCGRTSGPDGHPSNTPQPAAGQPAAGQPAATPRRVDLAALPAAELVAAVLAECHGPLRDRMRRVTARVTTADGRLEKVFATLPSPVRVQGSDGQFLLRDGVVRRLDREAGTAPLGDTGQTERIHDLATLLDAVAFGPLHRATGCTRVDATSFAVTTAEGTTWQLTLRPDTLLPASLTRGASTVQFDDYLHTATTWVVRTATIPALGRCEIRFEDAGTIWDDEFFAVPDAGNNTDAEPRDGDHRIASPGNVVEARSAAPTLVSSKAMHWVVLDDPAADDSSATEAARWAARAAAYTPVHEELLRQNQQIAGFPILFLEGGRRHLAVPFRARKGGEPLAAPPDWRIRAVPAGQWLVVHPPDGDFGTRRVLGTVLLQKALEARGLTAKSPITAQPFLHLEDGPPPADKLQAPTVRVAVLVE